MMSMQRRMRALENQVSKQVTLDDVLVHLEAGDYEEWAANLPAGSFRVLDEFLDNLLEADDGHP